MTARAKVQHPLVTTTKQQGGQGAEERAQLLAHSLLGNTAINLTSKKHPRTGTQKWQPTNKSFRDIPIHLTSSLGWKTGGRRGNTKPKNHQTTNQTCGCTCRDTEHFLTLIQHVHYIGVQVSVSRGCRLVIVKWTLHRAKMHILQHFCPIHPYHPGEPTEPCYHEIPLRRHNSLCGRLGPEYTPFEQLSRPRCDCGWQNMLANEDWVRQSVMIASAC